MSIVVSDLVARVRSEGVQQAAADVKAVGESAAQTTRALEIMAQQFAKLYGGTATDALDMLKRTNAQPTAAAMAQAAQAAEKTAAAVQASVPHAQSAAKAAEDVQKGWSASESSIVRFGAGLVGVGLGISLVAGAARVAHDAITGIVNTQLDWERSLREVHGLYGSLAPQIIQTAAAQAAIPGALGTQTEYLQAALNARFLGSRYGLSQGSITDLTTAAGRVADFQGLTDPAARAANQARFLEAASSGGTGLRNIGVELDPLTIARRLGGGAEAQIQALTPQQLDQARTLMITEQASRLAATSTDETSLLSRRTQLEKALNVAQSNLTAGGTQSIIEPLGPELSGRFPGSANEGFPSTLADVAAQKVDALRAELQKINDELGTAASKAADASAALNRLGLEAGTAAFRLLGFTGSLEDRYSIARGDVGAQAQAAVAARAVGPNPLIARTPAEMAVTARQTAEQAAYDSYVAEQTRANQRDSGSAIRQFLTAQTQQQGPGLETDRGAAQRALDDIQRRYLAATIGGQAQQAGAFAQRAQTEGQDVLGTISVQQDERRLAVAEQLAGVRREALTLEGQMAPLLNQQATLQDRMVVAARDNLTSRRALIQAEQQQLASTRVTSQYDYEQQRLELRAEQSRAIVRQGGAPTEDISALRQEYRARELERAASGVDLAALDAARGVQVVGQQRTGEQLGRDAALTNLEQQGRALEDQLIPLAEAARLNQAKESSIQRTLALMDLEDTKAVTAAKHAVDSATLLAIQASAAERAAQDMAANMDLGATSADRWAAAIDKGAKFLAGIGNASAQQADVDARIAIGLGGGGIGPAAGQSPSTTNRIPGFQIIVNGNTPEQIKTQVHIQVEDALNKFFAGAATGGPPAPSTVGGAGR
jgi:hypothetical protein